MTKQPHTRVAHVGLTTISRLCRSYYVAAIGGNFASSSRECGLYDGKMLAMEHQRNAEAWIIPKIYGVPQERYNCIALTELNFNYRPIYPAFRWRYMPG
ncbi:MAG: hypothetical protein NC421_05335 [Lachnospiraceae bacterium]|nr:hypothetical protein [Lachnospiraceae bacterium]